MTQLAKVPRKIAPKAVTAADSHSPEMLPASCELPAEVHAKVGAAAKGGERTFAAQLRLIVKTWAETQPIANGGAS